MNYTFRILPKKEIHTVLPLVYKLNEGRITEAVLKSRFDEMIHQNYECAGVFDNETLIGITGIWFCTRHYMGKSAELDHVYIKPEYRGGGLGKAFMIWLRDYIKNKGCNSIELNTYVQNFPSHKFYYNQGYEIWGYHFLKQL